MQGLCAWAFLALPLFYQHCGGGAGGGVDPCISLAPVPADIQLGSINWRLETTRKGGARGTVFTAVVVFSGPCVSGNTAFSLCPFSLRLQWFLALTLTTVSPHCHTWLPSSSIPCITSPCTKFPH